MLLALNKKIVPNSNSLLTPLFSVYIPIYIPYPVYISAFQVYIPFGGCGSPEIFPYLYTVTSDITHEKPR